MKIRYLSDLHLEFRAYLPNDLPPIGEDLVVLAGDIGANTRGIEWAIEAIPDRPVIYVLGNHEFYGEDFDELIELARKAAAGTQVHVIEQEEVRIQGLRILGCTLWTDFLCMGEEKRAKAESECWLMMSDFDLIRRSDGNVLTPSGARQRCLQSRDWIDQQLSMDPITPTLVVTHHGPTLANVHPGFRDEVTTGGFLNAFDDLIRAPVRAWIHGHHHWCGQQVVNGIPVLSNQRGYRNEHTGEFSWDRLFELVLEPQP